jgi:hypothetical protein
MSEYVRSNRRQRPGSRSSHGSGSASPYDGVYALQASAGNRAVAHVLQAKLTVGAAHDEYEQEADRVADQVSAGSAADVGQRVPEDEGVQRTLAEGITPLVQREEAPEVEEEAEEDELTAQGIRLQREADADGPFTAPDEAEGRIAARQGSGTPLPDGTRQEMESQLGVGLGHVRLQQDGEAQQIASDLQAKHFTAGSDIYVGKGGLDPSSPEGKHDLAHELTHVVQQAGGAQRMPKRREDELV